jgi:hypothetical protein
LRSEGLTSAARRHPVVVSGASLNDRFVASFPAQNAFKAFAVAVMGLWVTIPGLTSPDPRTDITNRPTVITITLVWLVLVVRAIRIGLIVDDKQILVRNWLHTTRIGWAEVQDLRDESSASTVGITYWILVVDTLSRGSVRVAMTRGLPNARREALVARLVSAARHHGLSVHLSGEVPGDSEPDRKGDTDLS